MTNLNSTRPDRGFLNSNLSSVARSVLGNRFALLAIAAGVIGLGAYSNWGWLVAAGLAPIILAMAPCAVMCAVGMCAKGGKKAAPGAIEGSDAKSPLNLVAPGAIEGTYAVSNQPNAPKAKTKHGCC